jgi:hypothetical protein
VTRICWHRSSFRSLLECILTSLLLAGSLAHGQDYPITQEVHVTGLRVLIARTHEPSDVLLTSLDTIIHDRSVCCGKDSGLGDSAERADPASLKDVAAKLQGRHLLSDGRPIMITAAYLEPQAISAGILIATLRDQHAMLLEWKSRFYVCSGVTYGKYYDPNSGLEVDSIYKFLLLDTRYSDSRREVVFNRESDDWNKVQGMLSLTVARP